MLRDKVKMMLARINERKAGYLIIALGLLLPVAGFSQNGVTVSDFKTVPWFKAVKLIWKATAPEGSDGILEIYRSDKEEGPYVLVQEIKLGDRKFRDVAPNTYFFFDTNLKVRRKYYYKLILRGMDQVLGPRRGIPTGIAPVT